MTRKRSFFTHAALAISLMGSAISTQANNLLDNGHFDDGSYFPWEAPGFWAGGSGFSEVDSLGRFCTTVSSIGDADWGAQFRQLGLPIAIGETYNLSLTAWSSVPVNVQIDTVEEGESFIWLFGANYDIDAPLAGNGQQIEASFTAGDSSNSARFRILMGGGKVPAGETVCFDNISLAKPAVNLLANSTFDSPLQAPAEINFWGGTGTASIDASERMCMNISDAGPNEWDVNYRERGLRFVNGREYSFSGDFWSTNDAVIQVSGFDEPAGYVWVFGSDYSLAASDLSGPPQTINARFVAEADSAGNGDFRLLFGGNSRVANDTTVCFDNLTLTDSEGSTEPETPPPPPIHVNQLGYLPHADKRASYALPSDSSDITTPRKWQLMQGIIPIADGLSQLHNPQAANPITSNGVDHASGDIVHTIDFSHITLAGEDFTLLVTEADQVFSSEIFSINTDIYDQLKYDALAYFYHNRSATPILEGVVQAEHARPAGHLSDASVETLACLNGEGTCRKIDASGGWYDAGDHGKYIVNGGISVWTLLNQYERAQFLGTNAAAFADGTLALPADEKTNGVADLLDEVRWELEWFFKMQIPKGQAHAGMVHHKMHDQFWTGLALAPHEDTQRRFVHPPSTAATLNFAAVAAQCHRVYKKIDRKFARECLKRAKTAYKAAKKNPIMLAAASSDGGGSYADDDVSDEFYWAATELYVSTGKDRFEKDMQASPWHMHLSTDVQSTFHWQQTHALGLISMATLGDHSKADDDWAEQAQQGIINVAKQYAASVKSEAYALPYSAQRYPWGSNSSVVNNMMMLGLASDFSCDDRYAKAMLEGADYLFGRNPLGHSYVTGYGTRAEQNPHHRFWANAVNASYPKAPAGILSGGPNNGLEDPIAQSLLQGCSPQRCFIDHIDAWSVNEITINWNAPFAWVSAYLDEYATITSNAKRCDDDDDDD